MKKTRILIIDDDVVAASLLKAKLDRSGAFETHMENRGTRGLEATRAFRPGVVLLDVNMPDADGGDVAFQIQRDKSVGATPILFLTSMVTEKEAAELSRTGARQFMHKPVDFHQLVLRIGKLLVDANPLGRSASPALA